MDTDHKHSDQQMNQSRWGFRGKTVWNWMELLIVPLALAVIGLWFTTQQETRQQQIENQRAKAERELAVQRAQDESLQAYLDQMSTLMLEKDLRNSEEDSEVRTLARARTLTVIRRVDTSRKEEILNFLVEANLVREAGGRAPVIKLTDAALKDIELAGADLHGADLVGAELDDAFLPLADLSDADLVAADLDGAFLTEANLRDTNLYGTDLRGASLDKADLRGADLERARGYTVEQLMAAKSLEGATMPNGQKYEDWRKDR